MQFELSLLSDFLELPILLRLLTVISGSRDYISCQSSLVLFSDMIFLKCDLKLEIQVPQMRFPMLLLLPWNDISDINITSWNAISDTDSIFQKGTLIPGGGWMTLKCCGGPLMPKYISGNHRKGVFRFGDTMFRASRLPSLVGISSSYTCGPFIASCTVTRWIDCPRSCVSHFIVREMSQIRTNPNPLAYPGLSIFPCITILWPEELIDRLNQEPSISKLMN